LQEIKKIRVLLIGGFPPPYGGITVHIQRLYKHCKELGIECFVLDLPELADKEYTNPDIINPRRIFRLLRLKRKPLLVHFHVKAFGNAFKIWLLALFFFRQKKIVTIHSGSFTKEFEDYPQFRKWLIGRILRFMDRIILVSEAQSAIVRKHFIVELPKVSVIPAFLYPDSDPAGLEQPIIQLLRNESQPVFLVSGGYFDYYGYEMIIRFLQDHPTITGIFALYGKGDPIYREKVQHMIAGVRNIIRFHDLSPEAFNWLLQHANALLRNIDRDGDCVTIREAGYWKTPAIATDAVERLPGTYLFPYNDRDGFETAVWDVLANPDRGIPVKPDDNQKKIIAIYDELRKKDRENS